MPIVKYFVVVGGGLLALLFFIDQNLPSPAEHASADIDKTIIRIHSARVGPEKVEFDTAHPPAVAEAEHREPRLTHSMAMMPQADNSAARPSDAKLAKAEPRQAASASTLVARLADRRSPTHLHRKTRRPPARLIALDHSQGFGWQISGW